MTVGQLMEKLRKIDQKKIVRLWDPSELREYEIGVVSESPNVVLLDSK